MIDSLKTVSAGAGGIGVTWLEFLPVAVRVGVGMATIPTETALFAPVDVKEVAKYIKKLKLVPKPNKDDKK